MQLATRLSAPCSANGLWGDLGSRCAGRKSGVCGSREACKAHSRELLIEGSVSGRGSDSMCLVISGSRERRSVRSKCTCMGWSPGPRQNGRCLGQVRLHGMGTERGAEKDEEGKESIGQSLGTWQSRRGGWERGAGPPQSPPKTSATLCPSLPLAPDATR